MLKYRELLERIVSTFYSMTNREGASVIVGPLPKEQQIGPRHSTISSLNAHARTPERSVLALRGGLFLALCGKEEADHFRAGVRALGVGVAA